jgi:hypothetical protein
VTLTPLHTDPGSSQDLRALPRLVVAQQPHRPMAARAPIAP